MSTGKLQPILDAVATRARQRRAERSLAELRRDARPDPERRRVVLERFGQARGASRVALIAECKRRSPSAGLLSSEDTLAERAGAYAAAGVELISVLTEQDHFGGSGQDLRSLAELQTGTPLLRKDFVLDEGMLLESLAWGASAVLLLAVALDGAQLLDLSQQARELGLASLVEIHAPDELEPALSADPDLLGVNARDLRSFEVDLSRVEQLLPHVPADRIRVAESGLRCPADVARVVAAGAHAVLVGEALMRSQDPRALIDTFRAAGTRS